METQQQSSVTEPQVQRPTKAALMPIDVLFKKSFDLYKKFLWVFVILAALHIAIMVGCVIVLALPFLLLFFKQTIALVIVAFLLALAVVVSATILSLWVKVSFFVLLKEKDTPLKARQAMAKGWPLVWSYLWVSFLVGLAVGLGTLLLIIPGIIFAVWFTFSVYILVFEGQKGTQALRRSRELVKGYWWPVFGRLCLMFGIAFLVSRIPSIGFVLNMLFVTPFVLVYHYYLYEDLKNIQSSALGSQGL